MRVLWFVNTPFPAVNKHLGKKESLGTGWWMKTTMNEMANCKNIGKIGVVWASNEIEEYDRFEEGNSVYYLLPQHPLPARKKNKLSKIWSRLNGIINTFKPYSYDQELMDCVRAVKDFKPDLIHVWGTENFYGLIADNPGLSPSERRTHSHQGVTITRFGAHKRIDDTLVDWFELIVEEHQRLPFDVLHAYYLTQAGFTAAHAGKFLHMPSVVSIRGNDIERAPFEPGSFSHVMYALQYAGAVTANASPLIRKAKAFLDREIYLIHNGVDSDIFRPMEKHQALAATLGLNPHEPVIGFVGELREKKDWQRFLVLMRK